MDVSALLARLIGPCVILLAVAVLSNRKAVARIPQELQQSAALTGVTGLVTFAAGLAIVLVHNVWAADWRAIITVFGWVMLIKGASLLILPHIVLRTGNVFIKNPGVVTAPWTIMLAIGAFLTFKGFWS